MSTCFLSFSFPVNENEFDAIIFFSHKLNRWSNVPDQSDRKSGQRYVMYTQESPLLDSMDRTHFNGFFNWTMTYRYVNFTKKKFFKNLDRCRSIFFKTVKLFSTYDKIEDKSIDRWDSDFPIHYGWLDSRSSPSKDPPDNSNIRNYDYPRGNGNLFITSSNVCRVSL
jgi:hypothetical protein